MVTAARGTYLPSLLYYQGGIYALTETGILSRYEAQTGKLSYKSRLDPSAGYFTSSPWAYGGKVFCLNEEGRTYVVQAGDSFVRLHDNPLEDMAMATPAIAGSACCCGRRSDYTPSVRRRRSAMRDNRRMVRFGRRRFGILLGFAMREAAAQGPTGSLVILIGAPGSGKSTIASMLSRQYGFTVVDAALVAEENKALLDKRRRPDWPTWTGWKIPV